MTVVNTETGELVEALDSGAAERRAMKISLRLDSIADNYEAVMPMIREAIGLRDDQALGYRSPGDYVSDRFGSTLSRLGMEVRREVVRELTEAGLSTRAIAPVVGVNNATVHRDLSRVASATPETPEPADVGEADAGSGQTPAGEAAPDTAPQSPPPVTGLDGKTYTRPEPKPTPAPDPDPFGWERTYESFRELGKYLMKNPSPEQQERLARGLRKLLKEITA